MQQICQLLDAADPLKPYSSALAEQRAKFNDVELTPSAQVLAAMKRQQLPFFKFAMQQAQNHQQLFTEKELSTPERECFEAASVKSHLEQTQLEAADSLHFDDFLAQYFQRAQQAAS